MLRYASLGAERPGPYAKSVPPLPGTVDEWLAEGPRLSDLATPVLTLDRAALHANAERMAGWCAAHGVDLAPHGIRVNAVSPSLAMHPFLEKVTSPELLHELKQREAFGRAAEPWEVANVMVFLASDYSSYLTGEVVSVSSQHA